MMPTLPINMAVQSNILDALQRSGVIPSDDPTVNRAEQLSKSSAFVGSSGSSDIRISEYIRYETIDNATTAFARRIEPMAMERDNRSQIKPYCRDGIDFNTAGCRLGSAAYPHQKQDEQDCDITETCGIER